MVRRRTATLFLVLVLWTRAAAVDLWTVGGQERPEYRRHLGAVERQAEFWLARAARSVGREPRPQPATVGLGTGADQLHLAQIREPENVVDGDRLSGWPPIELDIVNTRENDPFSPSS